MAVPFGFSVGDFIAVGKLVFDIVQAISERKGAAADYRSLVSALRSVYSCTNAIKDVLEKSVHDGSSLKLDEQALINGIMYEMDCCRALLNAFLDNTYKYTASLLPPDGARKFVEARTEISLFRGRKAGMKELKKAWRKVSWVAFQTEDVQRLERDLQVHLSALQTYEIFLQHSSLSQFEKSTTEIALVTHKTEVRTTAIFDLLKCVYNRLPPQISDKMNQRQPVFFEDALGRPFEIPLEFCVFKEKFQRHLEILFEDMPGHDKVAKKEYQLEDAAGMNAISTDNWHLKVTAGARVAMTLLFQLASSAKGSVAQICPRCDAMNNKSDLQQGMTECSNCKLLFEIVDTKHIAEFQDNKWYEAGRAVDASNCQGSQQQEKKRSMEQDAFRRIRYFRETEGVRDVGFLEVEEYEVPNLHRSRSGGYLDFLEEQARWERRDRELQMKRYHDSRYSPSQQPSDRLYVPTFDTSHRQSPKARPIKVGIHQDTTSPSIFKDAPRRAPSAG